ncbi:MmpS family transport accessory protein [Actinoplanes sp. CA-051413]|uniref:MmpS family transport accessory protein n=1 Tax=Actinoplanes sp. CA-051413 TaxID=3239899 RepID=UPI003D99C03E
MSSDDSDSVRRSTPADPWLTEAPTSAIGDAAAEPGAAGQVPLADTARFEDAVPSGWVATPGPEERRGRRATRWIVAVLAAGALFIAGMLAIDQFGGGSGEDNDAQGPTPSVGATSKAVAAAPTRRATTTAPAGKKPIVAVSSGVAAPTAGGVAAPTAGGQVVVYEVTASGSRNTGSVSYTDQDGDIIRLNGIALPWRVTFEVTGQKKPLVLISQRKGGGDAGPVTCTITLDGKLLSSTTADGRYAAPQCSG